MEIQLRPGQPQDAAPCGAICYEAFATINTAHGFEPDFPNEQTAIGFLSMLLAHPRCYVVVAESNGRIIGSNGIDERSVIAGIGPITVDPKVQNAGAGRLLMQHVIERSLQRGCAGVRLVQAAFHNRSLSLYTKLGFAPREPLSCVQGAPVQVRVPGHDVRPATAADLAACNALCEKVHGLSRSGELGDAIQQGSALVVEHGGRVTGYSTALAFFGHSVGESNEDLKALIGAVPFYAGPGFLVPTRNAELLRWCLNQKLRIQYPLTLMSMGLYNEPQGAFLPSIAY